MNQQQLDSVLRGVHAEGLLPESWQQRVNTVLAKEYERQPWYVRTMVGFGAWIASLLLLGFIGGMGFIAGEAGLLVLGVLFLAGASVLRRTTEHDFVVQVTLATSLAGQFLLMWGLGKLTDSLSAAMIGLIVVEAVVIVVFRDKTQRFLAVVFAVMASVTLMYYWKLQSAVHLLVLAQAVGFIFLEMNEARFIAQQRNDLVRPLAYGLLFSLFGTVMLSTIYVLPELISKRFVFYPYPWLTTLGFGVLLYYLMWRFLQQHKALMPAWFVPSAYLLLGLVVLATLKAPGIVIALLVLALGFAHANRILMGFGLVFFAVFLGAFFYGIEVSLLEKSIMLFSAGMVFLVARYVLRRAMPSMLQEVGSA